MLTRTSIVLALAVICLSGCDGAKLSDLAGGIQEDLGISVVLKTTDTDVCATEQAAQFVQDYQALSASDQDSVKTALTAKYKTILVKPTALTQTISGNAYTVEIKAGDNDNAISHEITTELKYDGTDPKTQLATAADQLTISTQTALHKETNTLGWALNAGVYQSVATPSDFEEAERLGALTGIQVSDEPTFSCGELARLKDIL